MLQILLFLPFLTFHILAHILGSATEIILKITLVDDFVTFNILNCKKLLSPVNQIKF